MPCAHNLSVPVSQWIMHIWYLYLMDMWINVNNLLKELFSGNAAIESNRFVVLV